MTILGNAPECFWSIVYLPLPRRRCTCILSALLPGCISPQARMLQSRGESCFVPNIYNRGCWENGYDMKEGIHIWENMYRSYKRYFQWVYQKPTDTQTHTHSKYLDKARARLTLSSRPSVPRAFQASQNLNASGLLLHWMDLSPVS